MLNVAMKNTAVTMEVTNNSQHMTLLRRGTPRKGYRPAYLLILCLLLLMVMTPRNVVLAQSGSFTEEVRSGRELIEIFDGLAKNPQSNKRALQKIAIEISQNTEARMLLKSSGYESLGSRYFGLWFDGKDALAGNVIKRTKAKLKREGYPPDIVDMIAPIQNESSRRARKAPMDLDIGIDSQGSREQAMKVLKKLGGSKRLNTFEKDLQKALEESYSEVAQQLGVSNVRPGKAIITGATHFHPEAYADAVLMDKGVPGKDLIQQTADVSKYKVDHFKNKVGVDFSLESAWKEAARGTLKDMEKLERVFQSIEQSTGVSPKLSNIDLKVKGLLEEVVNQTDGTAIHRLNNEIKVLAGGDIFDACKILIDNMEAAIRLKPTGILALDLVLKKLIQEVDPTKRLNFVRSQLAEIKKRPSKVARSQIKALEELERILTAAKGDGFITKILKSRTGQMLVIDALVNAPFALYSMYQAYERGELESLSDAAFILIDFVPAGISVKRAFTEGMNPGTVLSFAKEALYFTPAWPLVLAGDVLVMSTEISTAMNVSNYQSGLVDLLVYNGKFDAGLLTHLELLNEHRVERADLESFFFKTKYVAVKTAIPDWGLRINNLSEKATEVYDEHYLKADRVLEELRRAAQTQLGEINKAEAGKYLDIYNGNFVPGIAAAKYLVWLAGFDLICAKSPEKWCKVFNLLKDKVEKRKEFVQKYIMIPDLIRMAEAKHATLNAAEDLSKQMIGLQKELEDLRGSALGIDLKDEVNKKAEELSNAKDSKVFGPTDTREAKTLIKGEYWQAAFPAYKKIIEVTKDLKSKIREETGFDRPSLLQFTWSGDYRQDQLRSAQSIDGFLSDAGKINIDIKEIKGSAADPNDPVDKQALEILATVIFPWRAILDEGNRATPGDERTAVFGAKRFPVPAKGSPFHKEYAEALDKVRELYKKKADFQTVLEKGAQIVKAQDALILEKSGDFELKFTDKDLQKDFDNGALSIKWTSSPQGTFKPDVKSLKIKHTASRPGSVTLSVQVEKSGREKLTGTLKVLLPVKVPDNFLQLTLIPAAPKSEEQGKADTTLSHPRFYGDRDTKLHYKWSCANCQVDAVDRLSTAVIAPKTGKATVTVELFVEDEDGKWVSLATKQVSFSVDGKPDGKTDDKPSKDDHKDGQKPQPQVQPDHYTKGQIGITSGTDQSKDPTGSTVATDPTKGHPGIPGAPGSPGVTPGTTVPGVAPPAPSDPGKMGIVPGTVPPVVPEPPGDPGKTGTPAGPTGIAGVKPPSTTPKGPPACTYEYSAWGECNRGTKTQTRTVTAKIPAGCVERDKPALQQACQPPPTEEEKRNSYLNCLCRCSSSWAGHIGVWYDPEGKTQPECKSSGPCIGGIGAFGCSRRHYFAAPNDCAKSCYEGAYGKGSYDEKKADAIRRNENRKFKQPLTLKLNDKCPVTAQLGDIITLTASVEGGIPPHTYTWVGNGMAKDNTFTFANTREPGPHPISVTVRDDDGGSATATCTVNVEAMTVKIELLDKERKIPIGESRNFRGTVMSGDKPARGDFYFLWQPHPEIAFSPFEKTGGNVSGTRATFNKLGNFKVWVVAHTYKGNVKTTVGESEQIAIEVAKPELKLSFQPPNPRVGQEVRLTVAETPKMDDKAIAFWWEIKGEAANPGPAPNVPNNRVYSFRPKDSKPVTVTVHGKAKDGGDDLGEASATVTAQAYEVSIGEPRRRGSKPRIWSPQVWKSPEWKPGSGFQGEGGLTPGGGLVEVADNQFAVFEDIFVKADVKPTPEKQPPRYDWTIEPGGICGIPGAGQELRLNCSQTGTFTVGLSVRDSENMVLGKASRAVNVTVSQEDLDKAKGPMVALRSDKSTLKTGETAVIRALAQGGKPPYTYRWGDGVEGKGETARVSPKKSGVLKITLEVGDSAGKKASAHMSIKVETAKLDVALKSAKTDLKLGETVDIKAEAKGGEAPFTYAWGPDAAGKGDSLSYTARKGGAQTVSVEVTDGAGQKARATVALKVAVPKLEVTLKADKKSLKTGETLSIQAVVKGGAPPVKSTWSADVVAKGEAASFTPKKSGAYKITVDVSDDAKQTASAGIDLKVEAPKIEVSLKADKTTLKPGEAASLEALIKGGEAPFTTRWGSGVEGKDNTARFVADKPGARKASVEVSDQAGQKASASVNLQVEVSKLEVTLTADKPVLKTGEKGTVKATVKGGMPEYAYQWSSFVSGKGDAASFIPKKPGLYKVWLEVKDKTGTKTAASLDWKVEAGQDGTDDLPVVRPVAPAEKIAIDPENLKLAPGEIQTLRVLQVLPDGSKIPYTQGQATWSGAPAQGIVIDNHGRVQATSLAKIGARVKVGAQDGPLKAEAWVEVVATSTSTGQPVLKPVAPPAPAPPPAMTLVIEPKTLSVAAGKSADLKVYTFQDGRKIDDVTSQSGLMVSPGSGIRIDRNGRVEIDQSAQPGALEPVIATLKQASGMTLRADGIIRIEGAAKPPPAGYDPRTDPNKTAAVKPEQLDKVNKIAGDFQKGQWTPLDDKIQKVKDQPLAQPQPPEYLSPSSSKSSTPGPTTTGGPTTEPSTPGQPTTGAPTTGPPSTAKPTTGPPTTTKPTTVKPPTTPGVKPKDLTDVTVDRRDVTVTVWDHGIEDGDIINIYLNGKLLKGNLRLTNKKQSFKVQLTGGQNRFEVEAVNEGSTSPNTATVEVSNVTRGKPSQVYERRSGQRASMNLMAP